MRQHRMALALAMACPSVLWAQQTDTTRPSNDAGVVTVVGKSPTSWPTQIPATMEGITAQQIAHNINATDSEDADRKSTRLNSSHITISYAVFCLKKKKQTKHTTK